MRTDKRRFLLLGAALGHLILVTLGAASVDPRPLGSVGRIIDIYGMLSGADNGYGFFARGVGGQLIARFDVIDRDGRKTTTSLETGANREADHRVRHVIDEFWGAADNPLLRRSLVASLAGKVFARNPRAHMVVVRIEYFEPVSMEAYRSGSRPQWELLYEAKFVHRARRTTD